VKTDLQWLVPLFGVGEGKVDGRFYDALFHTARLALSRFRITIDTPKIAPGVQKQGNPVRGKRFFFGKRMKTVFFEHPLPSADPGAHRFIQQTGIPFPAAFPKPVYSAGVCRKRQPPDRGIYQKAVFQRNGKYIGIGKSAQDENRCR
jgi:hypothetical protein